MFGRTSQKRIAKAAQSMPIVSITGPRQSGKTTLAKLCFPKHRYLSLEDPDVRSQATSDPRSFLEPFREKPVILDEVQRTPDLFSYIQTTVDDSAFSGQFVLTGFQQFLFFARISQTLAGRIAIFKLFPLSLSELFDQDPASPEQLLSGKTERSEPKTSLPELLFHGMYPRVHDRKLAPSEWYASYFQTYIERDVRDLLRIGDLGNFERFMRLCANRSAELLNLSSLAADCGITHPTARKWLSVLEASGIVFLLEPHHANFNKRLVKSPKLYFFDTGLLCYLLRIKDTAHITEHAHYGHIFETFVVSELVKASFHKAGESPFYFWRDHTGHEIDIVAEYRDQLIPIEIKSSKTFSEQYLDRLKFWFGLKGNKQSRGVVVYSGNEAFEFQKVMVQPWWAIG